MKRREGTRETWDFCCVCSMPCTRRPIRTCILPRSHLDCNVKRAALFSPFASQNNSRWTLQVLKGLSWHQVGFGVPTKVFTSVFHPQSLSEKLIQPSTWQLVKSAKQHQSKSLSLLNCTWPLPSDKIKGLWDPKRTSNSAKKSWMWIIHNAQTAALFVWALSFCKIRIERSGLLRSWSRYLMFLLSSSEFKRIPGFCCRTSCLMAAPDESIVHLHRAAIHQCRTKTSKIKSSTLIYQPCSVSPPVNFFVAHSGYNFSHEQRVHVENVLQIADGVELCCVPLSIAQSLLSHIGIQCA